METGVIAAIAVLAALFLVAKLQSETAPDRIGTEEDFLRRVRPGMKIWIIGSYHTEPVSVDGPFVVSEIKQANEVWESALGSLDLVCGLSVPNETNRDRPYFRFISDMVNIHHGVFLSQEDAEEYFQERVHQFKTDPELIRQVQREKWNSKLMDQVLQEVCEDFSQDDWDYEAPDDFEDEVPQGAMVDPSIYLG